MFTAEVPADVHQFDCIQSASPPPWRSGRMGTFTFEIVFDRNQSVVGAGPYGYAKVVADMSEEHDVGIFEDTGADIVSFRSQQFFSYSRPQFDSSGQMLPFHNFLHCQGGKDIERHSGIVAFSMAGRAFDD